ncbi:hypothetical protein COL05_29515 [Bacillus sp. AFS059628]|uniref:hypothetical protein n=1 Tax=Bacillus sp. AFS059628 TaxID=2033508 RepID=UPI000BFA56CF|nr:hypothetical protein [Bacillus sp. AFS059628]PFV68695.1 hypothetical protein COL05_29515 [Bacillus sp. AFS059628]
MVSGHVCEVHKKFIIYWTNSFLNYFEEEYYVVIINFIKRIDEKLPKPPPKPPLGVFPGGFGGNTNNCNVLCNAVASNLALANALNVDGGSISVHLEYNEVPNKETTQTLIFRRIRFKV